MPIKTNSYVSVAITLIVALGFAFSVPLAHAAAAASLPLGTSTQAAGGAQTWSVSIQTLLLLTSLTFLPAVLLLMTGFTRIIIVLSLLRQALGTPSSPPNQVLIGLALFLTLFVMSPTLDKIYADAYQPFSEDKITLATAIDKGSVPLRAFMLKQTREGDLTLFTQLSGQKAESPAQVPMKVLIPAYVTSELKTAFQIGFIIFIPFLIIDMVVSPAMISLPFKLMIFVLVDGWALLLGSLAQSFAA